MNCTCYFSRSPFVEGLENTVTVAAVFYLFIMGGGAGNPGHTEHWASVLDFLDDCDGVA